MPDRAPSSAGEGESWGVEKFVPQEEPLVLDEEPSTLCPAGCGTLIDSKRRDANGTKHHCTPRREPDFSYEDLAACREIADLGVGTLGESYDVGQRRLLGLLAWYDEAAAEMERLGDELGWAREDKRLAEALAREVDERYNRLRRTISAALMQ